MTNQSTQDKDIQLLRAAYAAFNARDINAAVTLMTSDVTWPKAFKGGVIQGPEEIREYWTEQWAEIDPHVDPVAFHFQEGGQVIVNVQQVVRSLAGDTLVNEHVGHCFTIKDGLIKAMEICSVPSPDA
jgi:ketosteroid isomerase-like protein